MITSGAALTAGVMKSLVPLTSGDDGADDDDDDDNDDDDADDDEVAVTLS